jgi:glutamate-1-semialdehyde 2,1-aminomutase
MRFNDAADVDALFASRSDIAAVLVEPVLGSAGCLVPDPGFFEHVCTRAHEAGALVIVDELLMGFRVGLGASTRKEGVDADLMTFGKAIGSGVPIGAVVGTAAYRSVLETGAVARSGTYNGSPLATAAVVGSIEALGGIDYEAVLARGDRLRAAAVEAMYAADRPASTTGYGTCFSLWPSDTPPRTYDDAMRLWNPTISLALHTALRRKGVLVAPRAMGRHLVSAAHSDEDIDTTIAAYWTAAASLVDLPKAGIPSRVC